MCSAQFLLVRTLLHHVLSKSKVDFLGWELRTLTKRNLPQTDALLICVLCLLGLLQLTMHVSLLLVDSTDQVWIVQLLENGKCSIQKVLSLLLFKELPVLVALYPQEDTVVP